MNLETITRDQVKVGMEITAWRGHSGQGGEVKAIDCDGIDLVSGTARYENRVLWADITSITHEIPYPAEDCLNYSDECSGPVELWYPGSGHRSWPRCTFHGEKRLANVSELERYADSDIAPPWLDESAIGERWTDDY